MEVPQPPPETKPAEENEEQKKQDQPQPPPAFTQEQEFNKILNEIEMRFRKEDPPGVKEKRQKKKVDNLGLIPKICTLVSQGSMVIGCVFHVVNEDNTGEFDPYGVERMKNSL